LQQVLQLALRLGEPVLAQDEQGELALGAWLVC
jgi:hypothetical protein